MDDVDDEDDDEPDEAGAALGVEVVDAGLLEESEEEVEAEAVVSDLAEAGIFDFDAALLSVR